jgi:CelD/BcsL family acetyltransferase involved in cellulose biosynthesis
VVAREPPSRGGALKKAGLNMAIDLLNPPTLAKTGPLSCIVVRDLAEAEALRPAWSELQERCARNELTQSPDWLLAWWRTYGGLDGRQLRLAFFYEDDRLIGLAPLLRRTHYYRRYLPFRRLELLGSGEPDEAGVYSNHIGILAERGAEEKIARRFVEALQRGTFGSWDEVVLPMMSGDTAMPERLVEAFRAAGLNAASTVTAGARYIPLPASWREYLGSLSANGRRNIERSLKAFDRWAEGTTKLECVTQSADLERGKEILVHLHQGRWASEGHAGVFRAPLFVDFHERIMRELAARDALELLWLSVRGEPVAALYGMVWDNKVTAYQTGRRTDLPANLRPGGVLLAYAIRRAIEQGRREFDLQADDAFYKQQLTPHVRSLVQVRAARFCLVESARRFGAFCRSRLSKSANPGDC